MAMYDNLWQCMITYISTFLFDDTFDEGVVKATVVSGFLEDIRLYLTVVNFFMS